MDYSSNIDISSDLTDSSKFDLHDRKLEIGSLNLDNYNCRLDKHVCKLIYDVEDCEFYPLDENDQHSVFIASWINYFTWWDLQNEKDKEGLVSTYISLVSNRYYEKVHSIIGFNIIVGRPVESDLDWFYKQRNLFKLRFKDFHPVGFLSTEQEFKIKDEFNELCQELDNLVKGSNKA